MRVFNAFISRLGVSVPLWFAFFTNSASAQQQISSKVDIAWNRFYDYDQMTDIIKRLVAGYPELLTLQSIGKSEEGRDMWLVTLNNAKTGPDTAKPAMWIDGNVHGNEIQATETVLYSIWYLAKSYGQVPELTELMDRVAFYFLPSQNPDGRAYWFREPNTSSSSRTGTRPTDNDYDGQLDEDSPDDLNKDGNIGTMWKRDPNGTHRRSTRDPRIFERVEFPEKGEWSFAGSEGIDNDNDGQVNEDGVGGYDMNRNWPTDWQPNYIQFGAGEYPFDRPETKAIGDFILARPNIAAGQSYHNAGGMILRGPGANYLESNYPGADIAVYDKLGRAGEDLLPFYRYMIIHADLYTVHGGFVNWLAEGLGIVSFTNELWSEGRRMLGGTPGGAAPAGFDDEGPPPGQRGRGGGGGGGGSDDLRQRWLDRMLFGQTQTDWTEFDHPLHGKVLIGGSTKWASRIPPPFMLEEEMHRNFAFTMFHADAMPLLRFNDVIVKKLGDTAPPLWEITIEVENEKIIPTRTAFAAQKEIGMPDRLTLSGEGIAVVASGTVSDRFDRTIDPVEHKKETIIVERGIPGEGRSAFRYIVTGSAGTKVTLKYAAQKARSIEQTIELQETASD